MSLFDRLVDQALQSRRELAPLRPVVEKELLHHDIIREMSAAGLLDQLTFIGGTCLRACYGSSRLSEDLDFTGDHHFRREDLHDLGITLIDRLQTKYDLVVEVSEPVRDTGNVDTWKLRIETHPDQRDLPLQRINIDICAVPSYDIRPMVLRNHYGVDMGTGGLIIQAQSREEILADKIIAFALRPNRLKNRDLWDIGWLKQQNIELPLTLVPGKVADRHCRLSVFLELIEKRKRQLLEEDRVHKDFIHEMKRFLPPQVVTETIEKAQFWEYLTHLIVSECEALIRILEHGEAGPDFRM